MKHLLPLLALSALLAGTVSCADAQTTVMVVSDTHYLSPSLFSIDDPYFQDVVNTGAGKMTQYSKELLSGLVEEVRHQQPDLLLLTGDLTFNGELESHLDLAKALAPLSEEGIRVAVIPGNHDINNANAVRFVNGGIEAAAHVTSADFAQIWQGMLADEHPGPGFSGVVSLPGPVWLALGDYSVYEDRIESHGVASPEHVQWLSGVMDAAEEAGAAVISASHQTLLRHTEYSSHTFRVIGGEEEIVPVLEAGGCRLNLSGHMHVQHIMPGSVLTDIASGSFSVSPCRYGILTVSDSGAITYDAHTLCDAHMPAGWKETARSFFRDTLYKGVRIELISNGVFDQKLLDMLRFAANVNEYYFAGTLHEHPEVLTDPALAYWKQYARSSPFARYLTLILREDIVDALHWQSD